MQHIITLSCFLLACTLVAGQMTQAEIQSFTMPPAVIQTTKALSYVGDYGYYTYPATATYAGTGATTQSNYKFVRYTGVAGKKVYIYASFATAVPAAANGADACGHAHTSWGVWGKMALNLPFVKKWYFLGGAGMSGVRVNGQCKVQVNNPLKQIDARFGWGQDQVVLDFRNSAFYSEIIVGALSNTHGWGSCTVPANTFKACNEKTYFVVYTLPV